MASNPLEIVAMASNLLAMSLQPPSNGLQPTRDGSHGLQPASDESPPASDGLQPTSKLGVRFDQRGEALGQGNTKPKHLLGAGAFEPSGGREPSLSRQRIRSIVLRLSVSFEKDVQKHRKCLNISHQSLIPQPQNLVKHGCKCCCLKANLPPHLHVNAQLGFCIKPEQKHRLNILECTRGPKSCFLVMGIVHSVPKVLVLCCAKRLQL